MVRNYAQQRPGPSFIATEWDRVVFGRVREQRARFRRLVSERWPKCSDALLNTLALSLAYEADSHLMSFPNVDLLWLDRGRQVNQDDVNRYAEDRLALYAGFIAEDLDLANDEQVLTAMSNGANARAAGQGGIGHRDRDFAELIQARARENTWAFVIVGKRHASAVGGSMRRLLEVRGNACEVVDF